MVTLAQAHAWGLGARRIAGSSYEYEYIGVHVHVHV